MKRAVFESPSRRGSGSGLALSKRLQTQLNRVSEIVEALSWSRVRTSPLQNVRIERDCGLDLLLGLDLGHELGTKAGPLRRGMLLGIPQGEAPAGDGERPAVAARAQ